MVSSYVEVPRLLENLHSWVTMHLILLMHRILLATECFMVPKHNLS